MNLEKIEPTLPGINAAKLVTISRAIHGESKPVGVSMQNNSTSARTESAAMNCEYFLEILFNYSSQLKMFGQIRAIRMFSLYSHLHSAPSDQHNHSDHSFFGSAIDHARNTRGIGVPCVGVSTVNDHKMLRTFHFRIFFSAFMDYHCWYYWPHAYYIWLQQHIFCSLSYWETL